MTITSGLVDVKAPLSVLGSTGSVAADILSHSQFHVPLRVIGQEQILVY